MSTKVNFILKTKINFTITTYSMIGWQFVFGSCWIKSIKNCSYLLRGCTYSTLTWPICFFVIPQPIHYNNYKEISLQLIQKRNHLDFEDFPYFKPLSSYFGLIFQTEQHSRSIKYPAIMQCPYPCLYFIRERLRSSA